MTAADPSLPPPPLTNTSEIWESAWHAVALAETLFGGHTVAKGDVVRASYVAGKQRGLCGGLNVDTVVTTDWPDRA